MMAPSELAKHTRRDADGGSAAAQGQLGFWHLQGEEGLEQDDVKAAEWFREAADLGDATAQINIALYYGRGQGVEQNHALAAEWGRKAADQGDAAAQWLVGTLFALRDEGFKKDLPLGKRYLELSAAQGFEEADTRLRELRKCLACGKLDVHHMICSWCRNRRYCDAGCQLRHWNCPADPHKLHCVKRRESAGAEGSSSAPVDYSADNI